MPAQENIFAPTCGRFDFFQLAILIISDHIDHFRQEVGAAGLKLLTPCALCKGSPLDPGNSDQVVNVAERQ